MVFPAPVFSAPTATTPGPRAADLDLIDSLADEIATLSAHLQAETHRLLRLIAEFDRLEGWKVEGFASCADWLAYRTRLDRMTAREKVRVARALVGLPAMTEAMARGELSFSQVRALTRAADADNEQELLEHARSMSTAALERLVRSWKRLGREDEVALEERRHSARCLSVFPADDGTYVVRGRLTPEVGTLLMRAIEAASDALYPGGVPETTPDQRRADALALLAERALAAGFGDGGCSADRYTVVLHTEDATLTEDGTPGRSNLEDGTRVSAETSRRIACDASVVNPSGGKTRTVPPRIRRALEIRDRGCRFPGCGSRFTDAHHVRHWADGGPSRLDNLVLLCRTHHRLLHEGGFRVRMEEDGDNRPMFSTPRGVTIPEVPPAMLIDGRPVPRREALAVYVRAMEGMG